VVVALVEDAVCLGIALGGGDDGVAVEVEGDVVGADADADARTVEEILRELGVLRDGGAA
jgi:hypothetical protein